MHTEPAHGRLQPPQCAGFDAVSSQAPEHSCAPSRHARVHWPLVQRRPAEHEHTRIVAVDEGTPMLNFASTSGQLGLSVAFNPVVL